MEPAIVTLCVLAIAAFLFVTELIPLAVTAMAACTALGILGVLPATSVYAGLSNSTVVLFGGMFIIGAAMFRTGLAQTIGEAVVKRAGTKENNLIFAVMLVTAGLSTVSSNTGTVACLMPVVIGICTAAQVSASRQLMPMAMAANVGGMVTMIGTPPNVIVTGALKAANLPSFGFFEFAWIGIPITMAAIIYALVIGKHLLPKTAAGKVNEVGATDLFVEIPVEAAAEEAAEAGAAQGGEPRNKKKMWIAGLILVGVVLCMYMDFKTIPLQTAAVTGAILCIVTGCLKEKEAYLGIDWVTIFLFAGMLSVSIAMDKTGAGKMIANVVVDVMGAHPNPYLVVGILFLVSCVLTNFMSNTASAALLAPIGLYVAQAIGSDPRSVMMTIGIAVSCAFCTPMGSPPTTLVLGPGGYSFNDYVKFGFPFTMIALIMCLMIIPIVWPFFP